MKLSASALSYWIAGAAHADQCSRRRPHQPRLRASDGRCRSGLLRLWHDTWKPSEQGAHGRCGNFIRSAFPYDAARDVYSCPAGNLLTLLKIKKEENGVRTRVYRASKATCRRCSIRDQCGPKKQKPGWARSISRNEDPPVSATFKAKMETEAAKQIYRQRSQIAEFPHAWLKERCGLRQFRCRGRIKTSIEAAWACLG